jgi:hypothetical protein
MRVPLRPANKLTPDANLGAGQPVPGQRAADTGTVLGLDLLGDPGTGGLSLRAQGNDLRMELTMTRTGGVVWPWFAALSRSQGRRAVEPLASANDLLTRGSMNPEEIAVSQWRDNMVDRPETDAAAYLTGWTVSGVAVLAAIAAVWALGI